MKTQIRFTKNKKVSCSTDNFQQNALQLFFQTQVQKQKTQNKIALKI